MHSKLTRILNIKLNLQSGNVTVIFQTGVIVFTILQRMDTFFSHNYESLGSISYQIDPSPLTKLLSTLLIYCKSPVQRRTAISV